MHEKLQQTESDWSWLCPREPQDAALVAQSLPMSQEFEIICNLEIRKFHQLLVKYGMILHSIHCIFHGNQGKVNFKAFLTLSDLKQNYARENLNMARYNSFHIFHWVCLVGIMKLITCSIQIQIKMKKFPLGRCIVWTGTVQLTGL